ncbi:MAG TPA: tRNA epoxyqueuosine(34) reductase QueG [Blastocatellia bacterium]|nr:tRNA epoxyqueuosine(34) reductase QueG [Blastocatellia bacterium]
MTRSELTAALKARALELGFAKVGVARAGELADEGRHLAEWLSRGFHGTMGWMERTADKRSDPRIHMPNVRAIVCVADNYYTPDTHSDSPGIARISRYAWGDDYHDIVGNRLRALRDWLVSVVPDVCVKIAVDTSPVMDKVWASRAGLGWIGKHTNLITTDFGSWVFLGELLVDIELEFDVDVVDDQCGTCTACIDACPTDAIVAPYVVDSNRCISYATIELRDDELPLDPAGWVYGCDVCQDVCPWNRFRQESAESGYRPRATLMNPTVESLAKMSEDEFALQFRNSAIKRTKHRGLVRNARALQKSAPSGFPSDQGA